MPDENQRVVAALRGLLDKYESQAELSKALRMPDGHPPSQQVVSTVLSEQKPAGVSLARAVAHALGITFDELVTGRPPLPATVKRYRDSAGWSQAADAVIAQRWAPRHAVEAAGERPAPDYTETLTPELVLELALLWMRHAPEDVRRAAAKQELAEDAARGTADGERRVPLRSGERVRDDAVVRLAPDARKRHRG